MKILVVGLNHQIQRAELLSGGDDIEKLERQQKGKFAEYVANVIQQRKLRLVAEEAQHGVPLIAQKVATDLNCPHQNVEIPPDVRAARAIPNDYTREDRPYTAEQRAHWHREREDYMLNETLRHAIGDSIAVFCGREHVNNLASRFSEIGHEVETCDINSEDWYIEDWLMHVMFS